jgi:hypothetical protein
MHYKYSKLIPATGIIQVYKDFDEFQLVAANQLISDSNCEGTLPVSFKSIVLLRRSGIYCNSIKTIKL